MVIQPLKQIERQKVLGLVFIIFLVLIFLVVFFGILKRKEVLLPPIVMPPLEPTRIEIKNLDVLESSELQGLRIFEEPSLPQEKGRENPFLLYGEEMPPTPSE